MNSINIIGRLGRDPELRHTPAGKAVCELNLAVDYGWGENKKTAWLGVVLWENTAEIAAQHLKKGDQCGISGFLTQDTWDDKETGKKQTKTKITCERLTFTGGKKDGQSERPPAQDQHNQSKASAYQPQGDDEEDDIPF
jgi:single-strand DNA-binding protein